jgi:hypothetical protein
VSQLTKQQAEQAVAKYGSERKAAEALKVSRHALHDARANQSAPRGVAAPKPAGGMDSLRQLFGKDEIAKRKMQKRHDAVADFIASTLKQRQWMRDADVREELGLASVDFAMVRQEYTHLTLQPTAEDGQRVLIWCHPDYLDEARDTINGHRKNGGKR